ncbi:MAG: PAS domain-containing protein [Methylohalobius sp.]
MSGYTSCLFSPNPQEDPYRAVFETSPSGMFVLDSEGTILALNAKAAEIFGYSRPELEGRSVAVLLPPRYRNRYFPLSLQKMQGNRVCMGVRKDGRQIPLGLSFARCETETGPKIVGVIADISQRRQLLAKYRKLAARFKLLLEDSPTILYAVQMSNPPICTYVSDNVQRLLGYDSQKILKDPKFWQQNLHPEDRRRVIAEFQQRCQDGAGYLEYRFRHADGSWR